MNEFVLQIVLIIAFSIPAALLGAWVAYKVINHK